MPKRKRRSPQEMAAAREAQAAAKAAKEQGKQQGVNRIAQLESRMADEDANDVTPRPNFDQDKRQISRTASYDVIPMSFRERSRKNACTVWDSDDGRPGPDYGPAPPGPADKGGDTDIVLSSEEDRGPRRKVGAQKGAAKGMLRHDSEDDGSNVEEEKGGTLKKKGKSQVRETESAEPGGDTDLSEEEDPRSGKRAKLQKAPVREAIKALHAGEGQAKNVPKIVDQRVDGKLSGKLDSSKIRQVITRSFLSDSIMLTLDGTILFYYLSSYSKPATKISGLINNWVDKVEGHSLFAKPGGSKTGVRSTGTLPPLTTGSTRSGKRSALSNEVVISKHQKPTHRVANGPEEDSEIIEIGGLSDADETVGNERDAAVLSPFKGGQRVTSAVSFLFQLSHAILRLL